MAPIDIRRKSIDFLPSGRKFRLLPPIPSGISWDFDPPTPLEFPIPSVVRVWIFSGTTQSKFYFKIFQTFISCEFVHSQVDIFVVRVPFFFPDSNNFCSRLTSPYPLMHKCNYMLKPSSIANQTAILPLAMQFLQKFAVLFYSVLNVWLKMVLILIFLFF